MSSDFFVQVHEVARLIPKGRVTSYGAIAAYLGAKKASRTVGYKMENNAVESVGIEGAFDNNLRGTTGKRLMQIQTCQKSTGRIY